jgi:hypothetical protein
MKLCQLSNVYIDIGDNQMLLLENENLFEYKKYYYQNIISIYYNKNYHNINLYNEKYFFVKKIEIGNYIFIYIYNKEYLFNKLFLIKSQNEYFDYYIDYFNKYKLQQIINKIKIMLDSKLKLPQNIIDNINYKLNIINKELHDYSDQKILFVIDKLISQFNLNLI